MLPETPDPSSSEAVPPAPAVSRARSAPAGPLDILLPPFAASGPRPQPTATAAPLPTVPAAPTDTESAWLDALDEAIEQGAEVRTGSEPEPVAVEAPFALNGETAVEEEPVSTTEPASAAPDAEAEFPGWMEWDEGEKEAGRMPAGAAAETAEPEAILPEITPAEADPEPWASSDPLPEPERITEPETAPSPDRVFAEVADRLERIAGALRSGGVAALAADGEDPLALLVTGFALGSLQRSAGG